MSPGFNSKKAPQPKGRGGFGLSCRLSQCALSGDALVDLFVNAGGFIPRLFFLSACHSGDILRVKNWNDFLAVAQGKEPVAKGESPSLAKDIRLKEQPGYTGTAHARAWQRVCRRSLQCVMPWGTDYARELGVEFYRALLAHRSRRMPLRP